MGHCSPATFEHTHTQYCYSALREDSLGKMRVPRLSTDESASAVRRCECLVCPLLRGPRLPKRRRRKKSERKRDRGSACFYNTTLLHASRLVGFQTLLEEVARPSPTPLQSVRLTSKVFKFMSPESRAGFELKNLLFFNNRWAVSMNCFSRSSATCSGFLFLPLLF